MTPMMMGPRQIAGASSSMRKPMLMSFTPCATRGTTSSRSIRGFSWIPNIVGMSGP